MTPYKIAPLGLSRREGGVRWAARCPLARGRGEGERAPSILHPTPLPSSSRPNLSFRSSSSTPTSSQPLPYTCLPSFQKRRGEVRASNLNKTKFFGIPGFGIPEFGILEFCMPFRHTGIRHTGIDFDPLVSLAEGPRTLRLKIEAP